MDVLMKIEKVNTPRCAWCERHFVWGECFKIDGKYVVCDDCCNLVKELNRHGNSLTIHQFTYKPIQNEHYPRTLHLLPRRFVIDPPLVFSLSIHHEKGSVWIRGDEDMSADVNFSLHSPDGISGGTIDDLIADAVTWLGENYCNYEFEVTYIDPSRLEEVQACVKVLDEEGYDYELYDEYVEDAADSLKTLECWQRRLREIK